MSARFGKAQDKTAAERTATGRPTSLREITHTGWREWDNYMVELKGYLRDHYPDMNTICPDPMKIHGPPPAYMVYTTRPLDKVALAKCGTDEEGLEERKCLLAVYKDSLTLTNKKLDKQESDKETVYFVIRSMCSVSLNAILGADPEFIGMTSNDPLKLLSILKRIVTTKCDGHVEHDRSDALTEWYNLRMGDNEDIALYSRRASKSVERMKTTGIRIDQIPDPEQQAFVYIKGLNSKVQIYADYKNYLSNALETMKHDYYPKTLTDAINNASRFHRGTKSDYTPAAPVHSTFIAEEVRAPKVTFTPVGSPQGKGPPPTPPRSMSPPPRYDPRTSGTPPHRFSFSGKCNYCGQTGHKESRCHEKQAASSEKLAKVAMATAEEAPFTSTFSKMYDDDPDPHTCDIHHVICPDWPPCPHAANGGNFRHWGHRVHHH